MGKKNKPVDKVRASRDGHEYHEVWVARKSLELLNPNSKLKVLAVEGLSPADQKTAKSEEAEIADVTLYYGGKNFKTSEKVSIIQFKYSVAEKNTPVTPSDTQKTIEKFSISYKNNISRFGGNSYKKTSFQFISNRPISKDYVKTIRNLASGVKNNGKCLTFENLFKRYTKLNGNELKKFASICELISYNNILSTSKRELENTLVSLSATSDSIASSRLGKLKELVRDKAGTSGDHKNTIEHTDVLAALSIANISDLLPCIEALTNWGETLVREQTDSAVQSIINSKLTTLIHATGGVGKTVFMKTLSNKFSEDHEVIFFDSFGGGSYRSIEDARHLAKHGLIHIANTLAFRGLCDPILPNNPDDQALAKTFRIRLEQCLETLKQSNSSRKIYIFIDAIDNAEFAATQNGQQAFSKILLESLHDKPIDGVKLIVSCRTERKPTTYAKYDQFELKAFSKNETSKFLKTRINNPSLIFIDSAYSRSDGNARVLDYLIESKNQDSGEKSKLQLDDLLIQKIEKAIESATQRGSSEIELTTFLSGLTLLAPPVSIEDYALANKVNSHAITSMISDLAPLLEQSKYGVMFKDEPTETLIIKKYGSKKDDLRKIASNLSEIQDQSVFAAKTLPDLLYKLQDGEGIYALATDNRIPSSIQSDVGKLKIRYSRLKVAAKYAAEKKDFDRLIGILVEVSSIAEFDQRGLDYLLNYPELVVELNDSDAIRRIYEARTEWPGTRHARLGIIHTLRGELEEAHTQIYPLNEWVNYYFRLDEKSRHKSKSKMEVIDNVAEPLFLLAKKSPKNAANYFLRWQDWYSFEIATQFYHYLPLAIEKKVVSENDVSIFHKNLSSAGALLAALFFYNFSNQDVTLLSGKLAKLLKNKTITFPDTLTSERHFLFQKCFLYASLNSLKINKKGNAITILNALGNKRPRIYAFKDRYYHNNFPVEFLLREVIRSIISDYEISYFNILPDELFTIGKSIKNKNDDEFIKKLKNKVEYYLKSSKDDSNPIIRNSDKHEIEYFINRRLPQLHSLAVLLRKLLNPFNNKSKQQFNNLITTWENFSQNKAGYGTDQNDHFWLPFGYEIIIFSLFILKNIKSQDLKKFISSGNLQKISVSSKVDMIQAFSILLPSDEIAGKAANEFSKQAQLESDVTTRATYYANIAQSLLSVNKYEAVAYFKNGLLSVDAIGSGDYRYVNELLIFAASLHGKEMEPSEYYSLINICELNMNDEPHKFYWGAYGAAFSKIAGLRGLAQLSRWDDMQKIDLAHTLLPNLIALARDKKINPKDAIALNYLASPVEYYNADTKEFVEALSEVTLSKLEVKELIHQFMLNNSSISNDSKVSALAQISEKILGKKAPETIKLAKISPAHRELIDKTNRHNNLHSTLESDKYSKRREKANKANEKILIKAIRSTDPTNKNSFKKLLATFDRLDNQYELKNTYFSELRKKVKYNGRKTYIENLSSIEDGELNWHWVIDELVICHSTWNSSSISLKETFKKVGLSLLHQNSVHLIGSDYFWQSNLDKISKFSEISVSDLALELVKIGTQHNVVISGSVWLSLATLSNKNASNEVGQSALKKLLAHQSVTLGELASYEQFKPELYPDNNRIQIMAGLTWKVLGSFDAKERWRAAHAIRCFAKFESWDVISELVNMISYRQAGSFQCLNIKFYDYHARLWLLISLARLAIDYPEKIAAYKSKIEPFTKDNHVLFRYFSARILLECHKANHLVLNLSELEALEKINNTKMPLIAKSRNRLDSYHGRPKTTPKSAYEFNLDYDFRKSDVDSLGRAFNIDCWEIDDFIAESAYEIDSSISSYADTGNKPYYRRYDRSTQNEEMYGEQVAFHAMLITAGKVLSNYSTTKSSWDSWDDWLSRYVLTRNDGFWLSDTLDLIPLEIKALLREEKNGKLILTEDRNTLLNLANVKNKIGSEIIVDGHWTSLDGIWIDISSALIPKRFSKKALSALSQEGPFHVGLPYLSGDHEYDELETEDHDLTPWIVLTELHRKLDEFDPYGADISSIYQVSDTFINTYKLKSEDQFKKHWHDKSGNLILKSEIWRGPTHARRDEESSGSRLICSTKFLKKLLKERGSNLIILVKLRQYEEKDHNGVFYHSLGLIEINENLEVHYRKGCNKDTSEF